MFAIIQFGCEGRPTVTLAASDNGFETASFCYESILIEVTCWAAVSNSVGMGQSINVTAYPTLKSK